MNQKQYSIYLEEIKEIEEIEYALNIIYDFCVSKKYLNYTFDEFVDNNQFENTIFAHIIREDEEKLGIIAMQQFPLKEIFLEYIIVFPQYRNEGVGKSVINFLKSKLNQITLRTDEINYFEKLDFEVIPRELNELLTPMLWIKPEIKDMFY